MVCIQFDSLLNFPLAIGITFVSLFFFSIFTRFLGSQTEWMPIDDSSDSLSFLIFRLSQRRIAVRSPNTSSKVIPYTNPKFLVFFFFIINFPFILLIFIEGVCYAKKDYNLAKHPEIDVPNLQVIKLMQSFKSKEYVRETFAWMHYYWYLTNDGIEFLRNYLNLPSEIVPATLKKQAKPAGRPLGGPQGDRPRYFLASCLLRHVYFSCISILNSNSIWWILLVFFLWVYVCGLKFEVGFVLWLWISGPPRFDGERRFGGDRDGYRGGPRGPGGEFGDKGGAPADYRPSFGVSSLYILIHLLPCLLM